MAYIRQIKRKSGMRYTAEIKLKRKGKIVHQESRTFSKQVLAKRWAEKREAELKVNGIPDRNELITLADLIDSYIDEYSGVLRFGRTKRLDFNKLKNEEISQIPYGEITSGRLIQHINQRLSTGVLPQTANNDIVWINVLLKFGIATFDLSVDLSQIEAAKSFLTTAGLISRASKRDRIPTPEEHRLLIDYFKWKDQSRTIPMGDILRFAMYSARRQGEITRILWKDNNNDDKTGMIRNLKHPRKKIGNHKRFSYTDEAWEIAARQERVANQIFPYHGKTVSGYFTQACKFLDIKDLRFHDYRHLATSWLFTQGYDIHEVAEFTLHETWDVLKRYTHLSPERKRDIEAIYALSN